MNDLSEPTTPPTKRIQENLLARAERRLLTFLCGKMPPWVTPDVLTATGVGGAAVVFTGYTMSRFDSNWLWLAIAGYFLHWFGDSMDGGLARFRQIERPMFGSFIDHSCDGISVFLMLMGMGLSPYVLLSAALFALGGYLLLFVHALLVAKILGELKLSYLAAGPTELRLALIALTLGMLAFGSNPGPFAPFSGFDIAITASGGLMVILFLYQTLSVARRITALEQSAKPA